MKISKIILLLSIIAFTQLIAKTSEIDSLKNNKTSEERVSKQSIEQKIEQLQKIYNNLEFNTQSFDPIKEKWIIVDQNLIRNIFNQFVVKNELKINDEVLGPEYIKLFSKAINKGKVSAKVTKRYFDDEIERFSFSFKEVKDSLVDKLKLFVKYSDGELDTIPYSTQVNNTLLNNNIILDLNTSEIIDKFETEKIFNSLRKNHLLKVENRVISDKFAKLYLDALKNGMGKMIVKRDSNGSIQDLVFNLNAVGKLKDRLIYEGTQYLPDPVTDGVFLDYIVGDDMYYAIKNKESHIEVSKEEFVTDESYNFDIYLNFFNPELMFWQSTTEQVNKYLFSAFGKWGNDNIVVPGWFGSDYIAGAKLSFAKDINNPNDSSYSIAIGSTFKGGHPFPNQLPEKITFFSGRSIYFELIGNPFSIFNPKNFKDFKMTLEGKVRLEEYTYKNWSLQETPYHIKDDLFTVRNYLVAEVKKYNIHDFKMFDMLNLGKIEAGFGYSLLDIHHLDLDRDGRNVLDLTIPEGNLQHSLFLDVGVANRKGLFQHGISTIFNYNFTAQYGYVTLKVLAMLNNTFGIDLRFSKGFVSQKGVIPIWRNESYFIFSPIIRINY